MPSRLATANDYYRPQRPPGPPPRSNSDYHQHYYSTTSHPPYATSSSSSPSIKRCCCCLFFLFFFIALLIIGVVLVVLLEVKPKKPQFDLQQVSVQSVGISSNSAAAVAAAASSASLSLNIRLQFTAANPNKVGIKYGESRFTVMYTGIPLGEGIVPGFYQPAHSVREVETIVSVDRVNLQPAVAADLIRDASLYDRVELRVLGEVSANIRIMSFDSPGVQASVDCGIVITPKNESVTYKQCGFGGLNI